MIERYVSPDELRRLVSGYLVAIGAIVIFALFALIVVPGLRNANKPLPAPVVVGPQGEPGWLDPAEYPPQKGYELPPIDPQTVLTANAELLARGKTLFEQNCVPCHGEQGQGNGPAATTLNPRPRDFTHAESWTNGFHLTEIYKTLSEGIKGTGMTAYDYLGARDRMALDHYVQSLGPFPHGTEDPARVEALAKQFASAGQKVPNKIPVSMAMAKLEAEAVPAQPLPDAAGGTDILARAVRDPARAAQTLSAAPGWRENAAAMARRIVPGTPGNGFAVSVATFTPQEWHALHQALLRRVGR